MSDFALNFISLNIDGAERTGGADVLALAAANAAFGVHHWDFQIWVAAFFIDKNDGAHRAVACAVAANHPVGFHNAVVFNPNGMADLCR